MLLPWRSSTERSNSHKKRRNLEYLTVLVNLIFLHFDTMLPTVGKEISSLPFLYAGKDNNSENVAVDDRTDFISSSRIN